MELASKYNPADVEGKWYQYWLDHKLFSSKPDGREPTCRVMNIATVAVYTHVDRGAFRTITPISGVCCAA